MAKRTIEGVAGVLELAGQGFYDPDPVGSQESLQVVVMPFDVYSQEDLSYLGVEIPGVMARQNINHKNHTGIMLSIHNQSETEYY